MNIFLIVTFFVVMLILGGLLAFFDNINNSSYNQKRVEKYNRNKSIYVAIGEYCDISILKGGRFV